LKIEYGKQFAALSMITEPGAWKRKFNRELQEELGLAPVSSFTSGQQIQWLGHVTCRNEKEMVRVVLDWKPTEKRSHGRPRKR